MATYHMKMKIGYNGSTMAHLNYIRREGKYNDREDIIYTETCNLPSWAYNSTEFWTAIKDHDLRACRKLEFAIPNEISHEEQIDFAQKFLAEILPEHTYSYAIHETDSAIHGEKNPHVHVMFSERIIDERTVNLSKEEFFKKYGKTTKGRVYGGSKKDRTWAGKGRTGKLYQVREKLEHRINELYTEKKIQKAVSSKSLKAQKTQLRQMGAYSESEQFDRLKPMRLDDKKFMANKDIIRAALRDPKSLTLIDDPELKKRILQEKSKMAKAEIAAAIAEMDSHLTPTENEKFVALEELEELQKNALAKLPALPDSAVINAYKNRLLLLQQTKKELVVDKEQPVRLASVIKAIQLYNTDMQFHKNIDPIKEIAIAQAGLEKTKKELFILKKMQLGNIVDRLIDLKTNGKVKEISEKIRSQESFLKLNPHINTDRLQNLKSELDSLRKSYYSPEIKEEAIQLAAINKERIASLEEVSRILETNIRQLKNIRQLDESDFEKIKEYQTKISYLNKDKTKKPFESSYKRERIDLLNTTIDRRSKEYRDLVFKIAKRSQNINYYYNKLLNEKTKGALKKITEQARSKKDLIVYNQKLGKDTTSMQKELLEIERNIERLKLQYGGQVLLDQAKKLQQSELMQLTKLKQQYTKLEKNIQRDSTRRYISATTKVSLIKAKKLADKLLGKDDPHVGAAHIRTDTRENQIGQGAEL